MHKLFTLAAIFLLTYNTISISQITPNFDHQLSVQESIHMTNDLKLDPSKQRLQSLSDGKTKNESRFYPLLTNGLPALGLHISTNSLTTLSGFTANSNSQLLTLQTTNSWSGTGGEGDPIIVENYNFTSQIVLQNIGLHLLIRNSEMEFSTGSGIYITNSQNITVYNNTMSGMLTGLRATSSSHLIIANNSISDMQGTGIYFWSNSESTIENNTLTNNGYSTSTAETSGIYFNSRSTTINQNQFYNNSQGGIKFISESGINRDLNVLTDNSFTGEGISFGDSLSLYSLNNYIFNTTNGNSVDSQAIVFVQNQDSQVITSAGQIIIVNSTNTDVTNITFPVGVEGIISVSNTNTTIENVNITNSKTNGIVSRSDKSTQIRFTNVTGSQNHGISVEYPNSVNSVTVANSTISSNSGYGIQLYYAISVNISNNTISNNAQNYDSRPGIMFLLASNSRIENNELFDNGFSFFEANSVTYYQQAFVANNYVDGKQLLFLRNISGGTYSGNYGQICVINSNNIIIRDNDLTNAYGTILLAFSSIITIENNTFSGGYQSISAVRSNTLTITNNTIEDDLIYGIYIFVSQGTSEISYNHVYRNTFLTNSEGIHIESTQLGSRSVFNNTIDNYHTNLRIDDSYYSYIYNNTISGGSSVGIFSSASANDEIHDNLILSSTNALYFQTSYDSQVYNNIVESSATGIYSESTTGVTFSSNWILASTQGIYGSFGQNEFTGNQITGSGYGIYLLISKAGEIFEFNRIYNTSNYGIYVVSASSIYYPTFQYNDLLNTNSGGIQAYDTSSYTIYSHNYWDDHTTDGDSDGYADTPYNIAPSASRTDDFALSKEVAGDGVVQWSAPGPSYEIGSIITWTFSARDTTTYILYINGTSVDSGSLTSFSPITYTSTWQAYGYSNFTFVFTQSSGNYVLTFWITFNDTIDPVFSQLPIETSYEQGQTSYYIWNVTEINPDYFIIYSNGTQYRMDTYLKDGDIWANASDFGVGYWNLTVVVYDKAGHSAQDTQWMTIVDTAAPTLGTTMSDTQWELGGSITAGNIVIDLNPGMYEVYLNGTLNSTGNWLSGVLTTIDLGELQVGTYNITIIYYDASGLYITDQKMDVVEDTTNPVVIESPNDMDEEFGAGSTISWNATDFAASSYGIYINGILNSSGVWTSGQYITQNLAGFALGDYNFTIVFTDASNNTIQSTSWIYVVDTIEPVIIGPGNQVVGIGASNYPVSWTVTDLLPHRYLVYLNSTLITNTTWISGVDIILYFNATQLGQYNITLVANDGSGNLSSDTLFIQVIDDTPPQFTISPSAGSVELGSIANPYVWQAIDLSPGDYQLWLNGFQIRNSTWQNNSDIEYLFNADSLGNYNLTIVIRDSNGLSQTNTLLFTVVDTISPVILNEPSDIQYELGVTGYEVMWNITDYDPDSYYIIVDGNQSQSATWNNTNLIGVNVDGLSLGNHNITLVARDISGNIVSSSISVYVYDLPTINSPEDVSYEYGSDTYTIEWIAMDSNPDTYRIFQNDSLVEEGNWDSGVIIVLNLDNFTIGTYEITVIVYDLDGHTAQDSVIVHVITPQNKSTEPTTSTSASSSAQPTNQVNNGANWFGPFITVVIILGAGGAGFMYYRRRKS